MRDLFRKTVESIGRFESPTSRECLLSSFGNHSSIRLASRMSAESKCTRWRCLVLRLLWKKFSFCWSIGKRNFIFSAPGLFSSRDFISIYVCLSASAGKTIVSELLLIKSILETKRKALFIEPYVSIVQEKGNYFRVSSFHLFFNAFLHPDIFRNSYLRYISVLHPMQVHWMILIIRFLAVIFSSVPSRKAIVSSIVYSLRAMISMKSAWLSLMNYIG